MRVGYSQTRIIAQSEHHNFYGLSKWSTNGLTDLLTDWRNGRTIGWLSCSVDWLGDYLSLFEISVLVFECPRKVL